MTSPPESPIVEQIPGLGDNARRDVFLLDSEADRFVNANDRWKNYCTNSELKFFKASMTRWLGSPEAVKRRYHGWTGSEHGGKYTRCFVFKANHNGQNARLYGFLSHPDQQNPGYQVFVATHYLAGKKANQTNTKILDDVLDRMNDPEITKRVRSEYLRVRN